MPKRRLVKKTVKKLNRKNLAKGFNYFNIRVGLGVFCLVALGAFLTVAGRAVAQTWQEPSQNPPQGNIAPPIWNQNTAAQSANFWISGTANVDASGVAGSTGVSGKGATTGVSGNGSTNGVYGASTAGAGVAGSGLTYGVYGTASGPTGSGVGGAGNYGVWGTSTANGGYGVLGGATGTGSYGVYGNGAGYGVYGTSSGGFAGYFAGTLNATGDITQNGVKVCLADGTNCPSSGGGANLLRTDTLYSTAPASNICQQTYGSNYSNATNIVEVLANLSMPLGTSYQLDGWAGGSRYNITGTSYGGLTTAAWTNPTGQFCVKKTAPLRVTTLTTSSAPASTACSNEFSGYKNSNYAELVANWLSHIASGTSFTLGWITSTVSGSTLYSMTGSTYGGIVVGSASGSGPVVCTNISASSGGGGGGGSGVTSITAGNGISATPSTGAVTIANTGVTSLIAGTGVTLSGTTGDITINAAGGGGSGPAPVRYISGATCPTGYDVGTVNEGEAYFSNAGNSGGFCSGTTRYYLSGGAWTSTGGGCGTAGVVCVSQSAPARYVSGSCPTGYDVGTVNEGEAYFSNAGNSGGFCSGTTRYYLNGGAWASTSGGCGTAGNVCVNKTSGSGGGGVTSLIAGSGISLSGSTGDVTVSATGGGSGGSSSPEILFTRASLAVNSTLAARDAQCATEYGSNYQTAATDDLSTKAVSNSNISNYYLTISGSNFAASNYRNSGDSAGTGYWSEGSNSGNFHVACVKKTSLIMFTRTSLAVNSTLAAKDAQCATEYGSNYQTAATDDLSTKAVSNSNISNYYLTTSGSNFAASNYRNSGASAGTGYWSEGSNSGNFRVACMNKSGSGGGGGGSIGPGTVNKLSKWATATTLGDSSIFDNGANLGIGTTSPNATSKVQITSSSGNEALRLISASDFSPLNIRDSGNANDIFRVDQTGTLQVGTIPLTRLGTYACTSGQFVNGVTNGVGITCATPPSGGGGGGIGGSGTTSKIPKFTGSTTLGDSLLYDNGSSVGVNNTSPSYTLDVKGNVYASNSSSIGISAILGVSNNGSSYGVQGLNNNTSSATAYGVYGTTLSNTAAGVYGSSSSSAPSATGVYGKSANGYGVEGVSTSSYGLYTPGGLYANYGQIDNYLKVGAGAYAYTAGDIGVTRSDGSGVIYLGSGGSHYVYWDITYGSYDMPNGDLWVGDGSVYASIDTLNSDRRLKKDIVDLNSASGLDTINRLKPVSFYWKNPDVATGKQYGFIAQDVMAVLPDLVTEEKNGMYGLNYNGLIAPVVKSIQELDKLTLKIAADGSVIIPGDLRVQHNAWGTGSGWQVCPAEGECSCPDGLFMTKIKDQGKEVYCNGL